MTATDRLDAIEARANAATEGPWVRYDSPRIGTYVTTTSMLGVAREWAVAWSDGDATFIAHARTDVPALVAALRAVLKVHEPVWRLGVGHFCKRCSVVLTDDRPDCPTVAVITAALTEVTA